MRTEMTTATTRELYLENFDTKSEVEIAGLAGVTRQRIHQIERKLQVCNMAYVKPGTGRTKKERPTCPVCGGKCKGVKHTFCSIACWKVAHSAICACTQCGKLFIQEKSYYAYKRDHGQTNIFHSRGCYNEWRRGKPRSTRGGLD
jgi:hypothetical protein